MTRAMDDDSAVFERDGIVVVRSVLDAQGVTTLRALGAHLEATVPRSKHQLHVGRKPPESGPGLSAVMDQWINIWSHVDREQRGAALACIERAVFHVLGGLVVPFQDTFLSKTAAHSAFPWHQDLPFWPIDRTDGAVSWVALDDVDFRNGGVELVPGSHKGPVGPAIDLHTGLAQAGTTAPAARPTSGVLPTLSPGDGVIFHARTLHRSGRSASALPRRAFAMSWVHSCARWCFHDVPRHPIRRLVREGEEVSRWSSLHYPRARG